MRETEITCEVLKEYDVVHSILISKGFKIEEIFYLDDSYFSIFDNKKIKEYNEKDILKNCVLVRNIYGEDYDIKQLVYKNKNYDENNNIISEDKIKVAVDNIQTTKEVLLLSGHICVASYKQKNVVYKKDDIELIFQDVEGVGCFFEFEQLKRHQEMNSIEIKKDLINIIKSFGLPIGDNFDIKKAQIAIRKYKDTI